MAAICIALTLAPQKHANETTPQSATAGGLALALAPPDDTLGSTALGSIALGGSTALGLTIGICCYLARSPPDYCIFI